MSETYTLTRDQLETVLRSTYAAGEQAGESPLSAAGDERRFRRAIDVAVARAAEYTARKPTSETTPDAVEQAIANLVNVLVSECSHTSETASALDVCIGNLRHAHRAERARHAEEVAALRAQLREVTMERENRVAEMRAWGEAKFAGHSTRLLTSATNSRRAVADALRQNASTNEWSCEDVTEVDDDDDE